MRKNSGVTRPTGNHFKLFQKGNMDAFAVLYNFYYKPIYFFAKKFVTEHEQARDIVSESFMKLWQKHTNFASLDNVKAFLYVTTRNACMDYLRFEKRVLTGKKEILYTTEEEQRSTDFGIIDAEIIHEIYLQIENLPPQCGEVFTLSFHYNKKTEEIAEILNIAKQTVLNQKAKAVKLLRASLLKRDLLSIAASLIINLLGNWIKW